MQLVKKLVRAVLECPRSTKFAVAIYIALCVYFYHYEGYLSNAVFMMALAGVLILLGAMTTRRLLFSTVMFAAIVVLVAATAWVKYQSITVSLHAWDFVYYWQAWDAVAEWWRGRPMAQAALAAGLLTLTLGSWLAWRFESARIGRRTAAAGALTMAVVASGALWVRGDRLHMQFNFPDWHVSNFLVSFVETAETLFRGGLIEASRTSGQKPFPRDWTCAPEGKPPHILMVHQESVGPPMFFPQVSVDPFILPFFESFDGKLHKLNVETFGGASWLSESAVLLGLSSQFFGSMKDFVQFFMADRLSDSLPQVLEKCGYKNTMFYPYTFGAFGNKRFFESIGLRDVRDKAAQGLKEDFARDRVYYDNMLTSIGAHVAQSRNPMFVYLQTMSVHWPYDVTFEPDVKVPDGGGKNHPHMREYHRRLALARMDVDYLKEQLRTRFPGERFLLVQYGDHHALPVAYLHGYDADTPIQDMRLPKGYPYYTTYYSVDGINYAPPRLPDIESIDITYVGGVVLDAARIPLPESWRERLRLMQLCEGKAFECRHRDEILKFHRRLIESGLMQAK